MHKNVCVVELMKDENGMYNAVQTVETAYIRAYLKENRFDSMIYIDENLPSINDMSEDILSLSDEVLVFIVHDECENLVQVLVDNLKEIEDVEVYAIVNKANIKGVVNLQRASKPEEKLLEQIGEGDTESSIGILAVSPYENNILLERDISKYGIWLGRSDEELRSVEAIGKDVKRAFNTYSGLTDFEEKNITFYGVFINNKNFLRELIDEIDGASNGKFKFIIPVKADIFEELTLLFDKVSNCSFQLKFDKALNDMDTVKFIEMLRNKKVAGVYFPAELLKEENIFISSIISAKKAKLISAFPYGEIERDEISPEIQVIILENTRMRYLPFFRGFLKSRTGVYTDVKLDGYVHHLEVPEELYSTAGKEFINEVLGINSSIYVKGKEVAADDSKLYFNEIGVASIKNNSNEEHLNLFCKSGINTSNYILKDHNDKAYINSLAYITDSSIVELPYKEARESIRLMKENAESKLFILKITDKEDFDIFLRDAETYTSTHRLEGLPVAYGYMENACRFVSPGQCSVDKIPRLKIDKQGDIHACDMQVAPVAKIGTSLFELNHNCFVRKEKEFQLRGCYECPTGSWCSKCTQLPDFMKASYCEIMKKQAYVLDYVLVPYIYYRIIDSNKMFSGLRPEEVRISNEYMFNIISEDIKSETAPYLPKFTSLVLCRDKYLLWSVTTNKFYNVSVEFACVIELLLKRVQALDIIELLSQILNIELDESEKITLSVIDTLKKAGVLYREVEIPCKA